MEMVELRAPKARRSSARGMQGKGERQVQGQVQVRVRVRVLGKVERKSGV